MSIRLSMPGSSRFVTRSLLSIQGAVDAVRAYARQRGVSPLLVAYEVVRSTR